MSNIPNSGPAAPPPPVWDATPRDSGGGPGIHGYGGFWIRVVAYIIDAILLGVVSNILGLAIGSADPTTGLNYTGGGVSFIIGLLYFALLESSERGATLGKMAVGLRVVTDQGQRLSLGHALGRYLAKIISGLILGIGYLMVAFTDRKRGLHDMIAGTLVVKVR